MRHCRCWMALLPLAAIAAPAAARAQDVATFFEDNCTACHTIGGGEQGGPDLNGSTDRRDRAWLIRFLLDPEGVVASGDPYATALVAKWEGAVMPPTEGLTEDLAAALVDYIARQSSGREAAPAVEDPPATAADVEGGYNLFTGRTRLANGGPPCFSCHDAGVADARGARLGPGLAAASGRLGGRRGTAAWLARPPTPMMRALYRRASLTDGEVRALAALLASAEREALAAAWMRPLWLGLGVGGLLLALTACGVVWGGRLRSVRRRLVAASDGGVR